MPGEGTLDRSLPAENVSVHNSEHATPQSGIGRARTVTSTVSMTRSDLGSSAHSSIEVQSRKRRLELDVEVEKAKIRKRAIEEKERIDLELLDRRLATQLAEEGLPRQESEADLSETRERVEAWIRGTSESPNNGGVDVVPRQSVVPEEPREDAPDFARILRDTLEAVRSAATGADTSQRLVNRLTSNKSLPTFSGDCLEWLRFKQAFELSTELGNYSDKENLTRLYGCLQGEAKDAVTSLMITSSSASQVMETLALRFGNPQRVIGKLIQSIKDLPKMNTGRTDIIVFATTVRNCVTAMQALNHEGYLHSWELADEILHKMPSILVHQFSHYSASSQMGEPRLVQLAKFLYDEATTLSRAGTSQIPLNTRSERTTRGFGLIHATTSGQRNATSRHDTDRAPQRVFTCHYCAQRGHRVTTCEEFTRLPISDRWNWARRERACFRCLYTKHTKAQCQTRPENPEGIHSLLLRGNPEGVRQVSRNDQLNPINSTRKANESHTLEVRDESS